MKSKLALLFFLFFTVSGISAYTHQYQTESVETTIISDQTELAPVNINKTQSIAGVTGGSGEKCQIGDYVWLDKNRDGEWQSSEPGVAGVTVSVYDKYNKFIASTVTGPFGKYRIKNINPCEYYVVFSNIPHGYEFIVSPDSVQVNRDSDVDTLGVTPLYAIGPGQSNMGCDAAVHPINSCVNGRVWIDADENGECEYYEYGLANIKTILYDQDMQFLATTVTDDEGYFSYDHLVFGEYFVAVDKQTLPKILYSTTLNTPTQFIIDQAETEQNIQFGYASQEDAEIRKTRTLFAWYNTQQEETDTSALDYNSNPNYEEMLRQIYSASSAVDHETNYQEYDILQAWAAEVDLFIFDWHDGFSAKEKQRLMNLLDKVKWLNTNFADQHFRFHVIASLCESSQAGLDECIKFLADSVITHPAYYISTDQFKGMQAQKRPVFVSNKNKNLDARQVRIYFEETMPQNAHLVWNWDSEKINRTQSPDPQQVVNFVDAFYPTFLQDFKEKSDDYLNEFYSTFMYDGMDEAIGAVWAEPEETILAATQPEVETLYDKTWNYAYEYTPLWLLVNLWNDEQIYETDQTLMLTKNVLVRETRDHALQWKNIESLHKVADEGLYCPWAILQARNAGVDSTIVKNAIRAYFSQNYAAALTLLQVEMDKIASALQLQSSDAAKLPAEFALHNNYPNPFNANTLIQFDIAKDSRVLIDIFNIRGEWVSTLYDRDCATGSYQVHWDGTSNNGIPLPSGFYLCRMRAGNFTQILKMMYAK